MMKTIDMLGCALRNAKLEMRDIDSTILIGGSTKMPQVRRMLQEAFPSMDIVSFDPQHAVARGASLYARSVFFAEDIEVTSVATRTIGISAGIDGEERICNVIYRNMPLPIDRTVICRPKRDDQKHLEISVYESLAKEGDDYIDLSEGKLLVRNDFQLEGRISRGRTRLPIRFIADKDGRISVAFECNGSFYECGMCAPMPSPEEIEASKMKLEDVL